MSCIAPHGASTRARDALIAMTTAPTALLGRANYQGFAVYWPTVAADPDAELGTAASPSGRTTWTRSCSRRRQTWRPTGPTRDAPNSGLSRRPAGSVTMVRGTFASSAVSRSSANCSRPTKSTSSSSPWAPEVTAGGASLFQYGEPLPAGLSCRLCPPNRVPFALPTIDGPNQPATAAETDHAGIPFRRGTPSSRGRAASSRIPRPDPRSAGATTRRPRDGHLPQSGTTKSNPMTRGCACANPTLATTTPTL